MKKLANISFFDSLQNQQNSFVTFNEEQSSGCEIFNNATVHNSTIAKGRGKWMKRGLLASLLSVILAMSAASPGAETRKLTDEEINLIATEFGVPAQEVREITKNTQIPVESNAAKTGRKLGQAAARLWFQHKHPYTSKLIIPEVLEEEKRDDAIRERLAQEGSQQESTKKEPNWINEPWAQEALKEWEEKKAQAEAEGRPVFVPKEKKADPEPVAEEQEPWYMRFHKNGMKSVRKTVPGRYIFGKDKNE